MKNINCTVGILTYNSEKNLRRALESVKEFSDIIISDGGSTDSTLEIAREYGCTIIDQYTKHHPGPAAHHPIEDFARERNQMLDIAKEDWYLWIDSDEYISDTLREEIRLIISSTTIEHYAYEIPIGIQSPDASVTYRPWKQNYQIRFFNKTTGGRFEKVMHERFVFDRSKYQVGRLKGFWFVPLSKPDFKSYSRAVDYRIRVMLSDRPPKNFLMFIKQGILLPIRGVLGITYRMIMTRILFSWRVAPPFFSFRNMYYSQWVTFKIVTELYLNKK